MYIIESRPKPPEPATTPPAPSRKYASPHARRAAAAPTENSLSVPGHGMFDVRSGSTHRTQSGQHTTPQWWQSVVAKPTRRALCEKFRQDIFPEAIMQARLAFFDNHVASLTAIQSAAWLGQQACEWLNLPRRIATAVLFPGQDTTPQLLPRLVASHGKIIQEPQCIITADHAVLDGMLFRHQKRPSLDEEPQTPIVVAGGNAMLWENMAYELEHLAQQTRRDVLMVNYRNVGESVGGPCTTNAAVRDTEAVLLLAQTIAPKAALSVVGISIGGGCSAAAIASLRESQRLPEAGVAHWVGIHTFSSVPSVVGAHLGLAAKYFVQAALWAMGLNCLNTQKTLRTTPLAKQLTVLNATFDQVVPIAASLHLDGPWPKAQSGQSQRTKVVENAGGLHGNLLSAICTGRWAARLRGRATKNNGAAASAASLRQAAV